MKVFTEIELSKHKDYIAIDSFVYNIQDFKVVHPGGKRLLVTVGGQDASDAFHAFHRGREAVAKKRMASLLVGALSPKKDPLLEDFRALRSRLREKGWFRAQVSFFMWWFVHIVALEVLAVAVSIAWGNSWSSFWAVASLLAVSQIQAGWLQHDFGHLSVFPTVKENAWWHGLTIMWFKGASSTWWKVRHNRHHAKTNVLGADPDVDNDPVFLIGDAMREKRRGWSFTRFQHIYWWALGPPLVTSVLFMYQNYQFTLRRKLYAELFYAHCHMGRFFLSTAPIFGWWSIALYFAMRVIESHWFTWVTSMSHLPMPIDGNNDRDWVTQTFHSTQNLAPGALNNWITGHLNYQIEHHLFPTMPRHNYPLIHDEVAAFAEKHGLALRTRSLFGAASDVIAALRNTALMPMPTKQD